MLATSFSSKNKLETSLIIYFVICAKKKERSSPLTFEQKRRDHLEPIL